MTISEQIAPMANAMSDRPSYAYWRESDSRVKRFWYVSFCLMMSSAQDRLTGLALRESGNLNWATTAFYYSAVHAGRLVCFVCCGDYPTGHAELANLLAPTQPARTQRQPRRFHFDWLDKFQRYVRANNGSGVARNAQAPQYDHDALVAAISESLPILRARFDRFAPLLANFKNLRNDCNYEALLVAHEVNHDKVTEGFRKLVESAEWASGLAVDLATIWYLTNLKSADCFNRDREKFHAAHNKYLCGRFETSLRQKFQNSAEAMTELQRVKSVLNWPGASDGNNIQTFLKPIMRGSFGDKQGLMERWRNDIDVLYRQTGSDI
jgi:hypothetical protein